MNQPRLIRARRVVSRRSAPVGARINRINRINLKQQFLIDIPQHARTCTRSRAHINNGAKTSCRLIRLIRASTGADFGASTWWQANQPRLIQWRAGSTRPLNGPRRGAAACQRGLRPLASARVPAVHLRSLETMYA